MLPWHVRGMMLDPLFLIPTKGITWWGGEGRDLLRALMWDAAGVGCSRCGMQLVWDAVGMGCSWCGMQRVWDAAGAGCSGCGMQVVRDAAGAGCSG